MKFKEQIPVLDRLTALTDPTRCRVLLLLEHHELTVTELCSILQLPQSTVSRHLKTLSDAGWISSRREGTSRLYAHASGEGNGHGRGVWLALREDLAAGPGAAHDRRRLEGVIAARRSKSREFFASAAGRWDRLRDELFGASFHLGALLGLLDPSWVVGDLGCGTGPVTDAIAPFVHSVVAVDGTAEMLEEARRRLARHPNVTLRPGGLESLAIDDASLDAAVLVLVLHCVTDPVTILAEARRVLKPGGTLLLVDMFSHDREEYRREMGHVWLGFPEPATRRMLGAAGLERIRLYPLPVDPQAKGPALFAAVARRPSKSKAQGVTHDEC